MRTGRPNKYLTHIKPNMELILGWMRSGYTEQGIAKRLGVGRSNWKRYKAQNEDFREALNMAQQFVAALCVNALVKRALGYSYEERHVEVQDKGAKPGQTARQIGKRTIKTITKEVPPDVGAICVILFNRMPKEWSDKHEIKHSGEIKQSGVLFTERPLTNTDEWNQYVKSLQVQQESQSGNDKTGTVGGRGRTGSRYNDPTPSRQSQR